jgi:sentrin-specific protease 7
LKPGANKGYKPVDTLNGVARASNRKPTTYGKHTRPRPSLIGQSPGPGQAAYTEFQRSKAPTTPGRHGLLRDDEDRWSGASASAKRRKIKHIINLDDDEDDGAFDDRPVSARSSQSRLSVGSGTPADFKPYQATNEFREVDGLMRHAKKPRQLSFNSRQARRNNSPFGSGSMSVDPHKFILRDFQQGELGQPVTSEYFPQARINESTTEQPSASKLIARDSTNLRTQHRPVPRQVDQIEDSDSADELAISPTTIRKQIRSPSKAKKVAQSGVKRSGHGKDSSISWPLSFARSYDFDGVGSKMEDGHATLVLRSDPKGWRVQKYDTEGYETVMLIDSQHVNKVHADEVSRIRLEGPRDTSGNIPIFDLQFFNRDDFSTFRNTHAASLTTSGKIFEKEE